MFPGILLCSLAVLMLEVLLTRVFSFTIWYHLAYLTISTALLGFGAAGALLASYPKLLEGDGRRLAGGSSAAAGLAILLAMALLGPRPLDPANLFLDPASFFFGLLGYYVLVTLPFLLAGVAVATPLSTYPAQADRLYAADLAGAGLGCLAAVLALSNLDGAGAVTVCAAIFVSAGAVYLPAGRLATGLVAAAAVLLVASPFSGRFLEFQPAASKIMAQSLREPGTRMLFTRWSPVNRVDLYKTAKANTTFWAGVGQSAKFAGPFPPGLSLQYDAHNGSSVYQITDANSLRLLDDHLLRTPYLIHPRSRVMVIGVGGGVDVMNALRRGASQVTGVELQPITVDLLDTMLREWTGGMFQRPEVDLVAAEGRHYVRSHDAVYDQIQITMTDTFSAQTTGAYVLAESYLYTVEAFHDYFEHLSDDGVISMVLGDFLYKDLSLPLPLVTRLAITARETLRQRGVTDSISHIIHVGQRRYTDDAPPGIAGSIVSNLVVKKTPFTLDEVERIRAFAAENGFEVGFAPGQKNDATPMARLIGAPADELDRVLENQAFELWPVTDDRPFFYHVLPWMSLMTSAQVVWAGPGSSTGQVMLLMMLSQAVLLGSVLILLPLWRTGRGGLSAGETTGFLLYFLGLGLGFLLIEISFVQKYVLLLGYPTYSLSVTVFSLLLFAALGAALCRRGWGRPGRFLPLLLAATLSFVALEILALPWVREQLLAGPLAARIAVTFLLQLPLGLCLGMYFPTGIELLRRHAPALVPWAWGVNGVASVASTVLAVILGMAIGFSGVVIVASAVYAVGTLSLLRVLPALEARAIAAPASE
jgi:hypothetical protein